MLLHEIKFKIQVLLLYIYLFFFSCIAFSQNYYQAYQKLPKKTQNHTLEYQVDSLITTARSLGAESEAIKIAHDFAKINHKPFNNINKAIKYAEWEKEIYQNTAIINKSYIECLYNLGYFQYKNNNYEAAIKSHKNIITLNLDGETIAKSYCEIGRAYNRIGDYFKAITYYKKGIKELRNFKNTNLLLTKYINFAYVFLNIGDKKAYTNCLEILNEAYELISEKTTYKYTYRINNLFALCYSELMNSVKAKKLYHKNIELTTKNNDDYLLGITYNNLAYQYVKEENDSAKFYLQKGLELIKTGEFKARLYDNYSTFLLQKGKFKDALEKINAAIQANIEISTTEQKISSYGLFSSTNKSQLLHCLKEKIKILLELYEKTKKQQYLKKALETAQDGANLIAFLQLQSSENQTKLHWRQEASELFISGCHISLLLENQDSFFYFMEKGKSLLLTENILKNVAFENLPKHISDKRNNLLKDILSIEYTLDTETKDSIRSQKQDDLFAAKQKHQRFLDSIQPLYKNYFTNHLDVKLVTLKETQKKMTENEIVISYVWDRNEQIILSQFITKNESFMFKINNLTNQENYIFKFKELISKPLDTKKDTEKLQRIGYTLYKKLFPTKEIRDLVKSKNIIILADEALQSIPFEALYIDEKKEDYFINNHNVSYTYSMSFLKHNTEKERSSTKSFSGYAPVNFSKKSNFLKQSEKEVRSIQQIIGGEVFLKNKATKDHFLNNTEQSNIIHLATHANANSKPSIAFNKDSLVLHELYTYKTNANLVTLSACETSKGKILTGEGVSSLARGFFHAGANSVIASLWKVDDRASNFIMTAFYKNLKSGQNKATALTNAKRSYIQKHRLSEKSPYYWSSYILIGDYKKIEFPNFFSTFILYVFGAGILLYVPMFFSKRRSENKPTRDSFEKIRVMPKENCK